MSSRFIYGIRRVGSGIAIGARVAINSMPSLQTLNTALMRMLVEPLLQTFLYLLLSGVLGLQGWQAGNLIQATLTAVFGSCSISTSLAVAEALAWDRFEGTTPFVLIAAQLSWPQWIGRIGAMLGVNLISNIVTLLITLLLVYPSSLMILPWGMLILLLVVTIIASAGFGIVVASLSMLMSDIYTIPNFLSAVLPLIGGVIAPVTVFPQFVQVLVAAFPLSWVTHAARGVQKNVLISTDMIGAFVAGIIWAIIGFVIWRVSLHIQRKRGTLTNLGI